MHEDCIYKEICKSECKNLCVRYSEMSYLLKMSEIPKAQQCIHKMYPDECDVPAFEKLAEIQMDILNFVNSGEILYLYSKQVGNGKTTWSVKMMLQYFNEVWAGNGFKRRGLLINVPTYLMQAKDNISYPSKEFESIKHDIPEIDLVVFDDITATKLSNYDYTLLLAPIDKRIFSNKSMIFTGNYAPDELAPIIGTRLKSRICEGTVIELKGQDMRK